MQVVKLVQLDKGVKLPCMVCPCKPGDNDIIDELPHELDFTKTWDARKVAPLSVLHLLCGGDGPSIRVLPACQPHDDSWKAFNQAFTGNNSCKLVIVKLDDDSELLLAPVCTRVEDSDQMPTTAFWGYNIPSALAVITSQWLETSRMAVIFDLDETLLMANSISTLDTKLESLRRQRRSVGLESVNDSSSDEARRQAHQQELLLVKEEQLMQFDLEVLKQYAEYNCVKIDGKSYASSLEPVPGEDKFERPVVRIPQLGIILTRIDPSKRETSMLMRIRTGWESLRMYLSGDADPNKRQRFDVYVCTAAEREYAHEAWRLLDSSHNIIAPHLRRDRIVCVPSSLKKTLKEVVRAGMMPGLNGLPPYDMSKQSMSWNMGRGGLPLSVVIDDRMEVWEEKSQGQVLQVLPYFHYKEEAAKLTGLKDQMAVMSALELGRVQNALADMRSQLFYGINEVLKPCVDAVVGAGYYDVGKHFDVSNYLPKIHSAASYLKDNQHKPPYTLPALPGSASPTLAVSSTSNKPLAASLKPVDPRALKPSTAQQQAAPSSAPAPTPYAPKDPRRFGSRSKADSRAKSEEVRIKPEPDARARQEPDTEVKPELEADKVDAGVKIKPDPDAPAGSMSAGDAAASGPMDQSRATRPGLQTVVNVLDGPDGLSHSVSDPRVSSDPRLRTDPRLAVNATSTSYSHTPVPLPSPAPAAAGPSVKLEPEADSLASGSNPSRQVMPPTPFGHGSSQAHANLDPRLGSLVPQDPRKQMGQSGSGSLPVGGSTPTGRMPSGEVPNEYVPPADPRRALLRQAGSSRGGCDQADPAKVGDITGVASDETGIKRPRLEAPLSATVTNAAGSSAHIQTGEAVTGVATSSGFSNAGGAHIQAVNNLVTSSSASDSTALQAAGSRSDMGTDPSSVPGSVGDAQQGTGWGSVPGPSQAGGSVVEGDGSRGVQGGALPGPSGTMMTLPALTQAMNVNQPGQSSLPLPPQTLLGGINPSQTGSQPAGSGSFLPQDPRRALMTRPPGPQPSNGAPPTPPRPPETPPPLTGPIPPPQPPPNPPPRRSLPPTPTPTPLTLPTAGDIIPTPPTSSSQSIHLQELPKPPKPHPPALTFPPSTSSAIPTTILTPPSSISPGHTIVIPSLTPNTTSQPSNPAHVMLIDIPGHGQVLVDLSQAQTQTPLPQPPQPPSQPPPPQAPTQPPPPQPPLQNPPHQLMVVSSGGGGSAGVSPAGMAQMGIVMTGGGQTPPSGAGIVQDPRQAFKLGPQHMPGADLPSTIPTAALAHNQPGKSPSHALASPVPLPPKPNLGPIALPPGARPPAPVGIPPPAPPPGPAPPSGPPLPLPPGPLTHSAKLPLPPGPMPPKSHPPPPTAPIPPNLLKALPPNVSRVMRPKKIPQGPDVVPVPPGLNPLATSSPPISELNSDDASGSPSVNRSENPISALNELAQRKKANVRYVEQRKPSDPDRAGWTVEVFWNDMVIGQGYARNKKDAKKVAAANALQGYERFEAANVLPPAPIVTGNAPAADVNDPAAPSSSSGPVTESNALATLQTLFPGQVMYYDMGAEGPAHSKMFRVKVEVENGKHVAYGQALSKKHAKQAAALNILQQLDIDKPLRPRAASSTLPPPSLADPAQPSASLLGRRGPSSSGRSDPDHDGTYPSAKRPRFDGPSQATSSRRGEENRSSDEWFRDGYTRAGSGSLPPTDYLPGQERERSRGKAGEVGRPLRGSSRIHGAGGSGSPLDKRKGMEYKHRSSSCSPPHRTLPPHHVEHMDVDSKANIAAAIASATAALAGESGSSPAGGRTPRSSSEPNSGSEPVTTMPQIKQEESDDDTEEGEIT